MRPGRGAGAGGGIGTMVAHRIALIPGDGIGQEVTPAAVRVLDVVGERHGITFGYDEFDWSCARYRELGAMMPEDGLDRLRHRRDLGAVLEFLGS